MSKSLTAGAAGALLLLCLAGATERTQAQGTATPTPAACAASRTRAEQAGTTLQDLSEAARFAMDRDRIRSLEELAYSRSLANDPTEPERVRNESAYNVCLYEYRLAQLGGIPMPRIRIVSTSSVRSAQGGIARAFVAAWNGEAAYAAPTGNMATNPLTAIAALERSPADGSQLLLISIPVPTAAGARRILDALAPLQRVRMVAGPFTDRSVQSGMALFAPSNTPAAQVRELQRQANAAMTNPAVANALRFRRAAPSAANITETLASVRSQLPPPQQARTQPAPPRPVPSDNGAGWPEGVAPGNLYVIKTCPTGAFTSPIQCRMRLVSGRSRDEAMAVATKLIRDLRPSPDWPLDSAEVIKECSGPGWGATVHYLGDENKMWVGYGCGWSTPEAALRVASLACADERKAPCAYTPRLMTDQGLQILVGHSGAPVTGIPAVFHNWTTSHLWAVAGNLSGYVQPVFSGEDAVGKLGKSCSTFGQSPYTISCFLTFRNFDCINRSNGPEIQFCVDAGYTASGVLPYVVPLPRR